jgi:hypothetical protein
MSTVLPPTHLGNIIQVQQNSGSSLEPIQPCQPQGEGVLVGQEVLWQPGQEVGSDTTIVRKGS